MEDLLRGVDVSSYQGSIDWNTLRRFRRDIAFAYVRTAEWRTDTPSGGLIDSQAEKNISEAAKNGIIPGVYQRANLDLNTPEKEAAEFVAHIRHLDAWKKGSLIPAIDVEYSVPALKAPDLNQWVREFVQTYFDMSPVHKLVFYSSSSFITKYYNAVIGMPNVGLWVGHTERYSVPKDTPAEEWAGRANNFSGQGLVHQYTHSLTLPGITENTVDGNCLMPGVELHQVMV